MEEDNRSYHPTSNPFRQSYQQFDYHQQCECECVNVDDDVDADDELMETKAAEFTTAVTKDGHDIDFTTTTTTGVSMLIAAAAQQDEQQDDPIIDSNNNDIIMMRSNIVNANANVNDSDSDSDSGSSSSSVAKGRGGGGGGNRRISFDEKLPSLAYLLSSAGDNPPPPAPPSAPPTAAPPHCPVRRGAIRGMVLVVAEEEETANASTIRGMVPVQEEPLQEQEEQQQFTTTSSTTSTNSNARMNRLLVETHGLFYDYQRRFYRQSLTEQAEELLEQAAASASSLALASENDGSSYSSSIAIVKNLTLYTDALQLCQKSIQDHYNGGGGGGYGEGNNNNNNNIDNDRTVGGSYLVTGDIRIRRKAELLVAKIYCLRASHLYNKMENYNKCLDDCNSAITIWNRSEQSSIGRRQLRRRMKQQLQSRQISQEQEQRLLVQPPRRRLLLSHKHLYLLKAKALAGLGRYNEASMWLLSKDQTPYKNFHGESQLIQNNGNMYNVLHGISNRGDGCGFGESESEKTTTLTTTNDRLMDITTAATTTTVTTTRTKNIIPTEQSLWPILIHNVQQRLEYSSPSSRYAGSSSSCTSNAIYQLLRNGPVLFNHV